MSVLPRTDRLRWAVAALFLGLGLALALNPRRCIDFTVFRNGRSAAARRHQLYRAEDGPMPFKYAPPVAVLFAPLALLPRALGRGAVERGLGGAAPARAVDGSAARRPGAAGCRRELGGAGPRRPGGDGPLLRTGGPVAARAGHAGRGGGRRPWGRRRGARSGGPHQAPGGRSPGSSSSSAGAGARSPSARRWCCSPAALLAARVGPGHGRRRAHRLAAASSSGAPSSGSPARIRRAFPPSSWTSLAGSGRRPARGRSGSPSSPPPSSSPRSSWRRGATQARRSG